MSDLFGTFSEPPYTTVGDPYDKPHKDTAHKKVSTKPFLYTQPPKKGKAPDAYLDKKIRSLGEGDLYVDAWIRDRQFAKGTGKNVSQKAFYALVAPRCSMSCGPGSNDGCLTEVAHDTDGSAAAALSAHPRRPADKLKNMYTSYPKKGGFGQPWKDRSLGQPPVYYCDVYEGGREKEKELRAKLKGVTTKPFLATARPNRPFAGDAEVFSKTAPEGSTSTAKRSASAPHVRAWKSPGPSKQGAAYCILSHVGRDHVPDPVLEAKYHAKDRAPKPFRPIGGTKGRLSMWTPTAYNTEPRPAPDIDFTTL